jgi:hypothetical protein
LEAFIHAEPTTPAGEAAKLRYALDEERRGNPFSRRHLLAIIDSAAKGLPASSIPAAAGDVELQPCLATTKPRRPGS